MSLKFIKFSLLLSLLFIVGAASPSDCASALAVIQSDLTRYTQYMNLTALTQQPSNTSINFFVYSGRTINDFGEFETCQQENQSHYLTMFFTGVIPPNTAKLAMMIGMCAPIECSAADAKANSETIMQLFLQGMALPLQVMTTSVGLNFYDPNYPNYGDQETAVIVWIILLAILSLSVAGTLMNIFFEMKDEARIRPQDLSLSGVMSPEREQRQREYKGVLKFLDCFDVKKNMSRLVTVKYTDQYDYNLEIFNGIRVLCFMYVVYGHTYLFGTNYADNMIDFLDVTRTWWFLVPFAALYSVDVFFYMSGFFFAFIALGKLEKMRPGCKSFIILALHRLFRIWPTYAIAILFFWKVLPYMGAGPVWFQMTYFTNLCDNGNVFENLSLLDDFLVKSETYCYGWGWYLSNDFQMFLLTPWFLWIYISNKRKGKLYISLLIIASITFAIFYGDYLGVSASPPTNGGITNPDAFRLYYVKPYVRLPPYFIGVLVGLFYKEYKEKEGWSYQVGEACRRPLLKWTLQITGFAMMMFIVFYVRQVQSDPTVWSRFFHALWRGIAKSAYVISMTLIILPSILGENTLLKRFLSHPLWTPLARMAFSAYLVHLFWIMRGYFNETAAFHFTTETILYYTLANGGMALATACILSVLAEVPLANIESTYITKRKPRAKSPTKEPSKNDYKAPNLHEERKLSLGENLSEASTNVDEKEYSKMPEDA